MRTWWGWAEGRVCLSVGIGRRRCSRRFIGKGQEAQQDPLAFSRARLSNLKALTSRCPDTMAKVFKRGFATLGLRHTCPPS